jgi:hypothetical protein
MIDPKTGSRVGFPLAWYKTNPPVKINLTGGMGSLEIKNGTTIIIMQLLT